ncbi:hypothetical protein DEO72_LG7g805 [Vigna unguiculata]|uniref:Uncharacterized protein n=1 Tax=Vigna unguiculata TaxID=3917 RepID=A0A4D6MFF1_VIGUN|nr:hypothetical protein DEO72_LG7g805 [Vigna unguiculata]
MNYQSYKLPPQRLYHFNTHGNARFPPTAAPSSNTEPTPPSSMHSATAAAPETCDHDAAFKPPMQCTNNTPPSATQSNNHVAGAAPVRAVARNSRHCTSN